MLKKTSLANVLLSVLISTFLSQTSLAGVLTGEYAGDNSPITQEDLLGGYIFGLLIVESPEGEHFRFLFEMKLEADGELSFRQGVATSRDGATPAGLCKGEYRLVGELFRGDITCGEANFGLDIDLRKHSKWDLSDGFGTLVKSTELPKPLKFTIFKRSQPYFRVPRLEMATTAIVVE